MITILFVAFIFCHLTGSFGSIELYAMPAESGSHSPLHVCMDECKDVLAASPGQDDLPIFNPSMVLQHVESLKVQLVVRNLRCRQACASYPLQDFPRYLRFSTILN